MAIETAIDLAGYFSIADFAIAATYLPQGIGQGVTVNIVLDQAHADAGLFNTGYSAQAFLATARRTDMPNAAEGDVLQTALGNFRVQKTELDVDAVIWRLELRKD